MMKLSLQDLEDILEWAEGFTYKSVNSESQNKLLARLVELKQEQILMEQNDKRI